MSIEFVSRTFDQRHFKVILGYLVQVLILCKSNFQHATYPTVAGLCHSKVLQKAPSDGRHKNAIWVPENVAAKRFCRKKLSLPLYYAGNETISTSTTFLGPRL